jgi:lysyl-tRNA synthetase class II
VLHPTKAFHPPRNLRAGCCVVTDRTPVPYRFDPDATAAGLHDSYGHLEAGVETGDRVTVAGRLMLRRVQGKLAFGSSPTRTGRIQLFAPSATSPPTSRTSASSASGTGSGSPVR